MTNYNEGLDEIERHFRAAWKQTQHKTVQVPAYGLAWHEAKQAITSLTKELVAEAKPGIHPYLDNEIDGGYAQTIYGAGILDYQNNLLKALEEV